MNLLEYIGKGVKRKLITEPLNRERLQAKVTEHLNSDFVKNALKANEYYKNRTEVQDKTKEFTWQYNSKLSLGLYKPLLDQKVGYLFSKTPSITTGSEEEQEVIDEIFDQAFQYELKRIGADTISKGVGYGLLYFNEAGKLKILRVPAEQIIPEYKDETSDELSGFTRVYPEYYWVGSRKLMRYVIENYHSGGISYYSMDAFGSNLRKHPEYEDSPHYYMKTASGDVQGYLWDRVPLVVFKANADQAGLFNQVKDEIDNLEAQRSTAAEVLLQSPENILKLRNYGGEDPAEFKRLLNAYRIILLGEDGDLENLNIPTNDTATVNEIQRSRQNLYAASQAIDFLSTDLGNASGESLKWRYQGMDLDANNFEIEFRRSLNYILWFVNVWARLNKRTEVDHRTFVYTFNRNLMSNEREQVEMARNSVGLISQQTIVENHPWSKPDELDRINQERQAEAAAYFEGDEW